MSPDHVLDPRDPELQAPDAEAASAEPAIPGDHGPTEAGAPVPDEPAAPDAGGPAEPAAGGDAPPRAGLPARTTPPPAMDREPLDLARRIVELAEDKKAADIVLLEIAPFTTVADYLVLCSGGSERQLDGIADGIVEGLKAEGTRPLAREGEAASHWVLLDVGAVIVHVFAPPEREFYALERLWAEARTVLRVQ
jgi:ribosome-associated protein